MCMRRQRSVANTSVSPKPLISLRRVSRFFRSDKSALFDVSFDIFPQEFVYIAGASGAGKSTLLKLLHAVEMADTGAVIFNGLNIANLKQQAIALLRRSMGVIFQDFMLIPDLSLSANVGLPLEVAGLSPSRVAARVEEILEQVGLKGRGSDIAEGLSGGEQQRAAIARALVGRPELILADEPTGSLDAYNADFALDLLEQAQASGATVVLATHDRMLMAARPHRTIALDSGRVVGMSSRGSGNSNPQASTQAKQQIG
jgi:cell division transport system ATP-binding protein